MATSSQTMSIKLKLIELAIRAAMMILRRVVAWRLIRTGFSRVPGSHNWSMARERISPTDPEVTVTVHEGTAVKDLVSAAVVSIFYKKSQL